MTWTKAENSAATILILSGKVHSTLNNRSTFLYITVHKTVSLQITWNNLSRGAGFDQPVPSCQGTASCGVWNYVFKLFRNSIAGWDALKSLNYCVSMRPVSPATASCHCPISTCLSALSLSAWSGDIYHCDLEFVLPCRSTRICVVFMFFIYSGDRTGLCTDLYRLQLRNIVKHIWGVRGRGGDTLLQYVEYTLYYHKYLLTHPNDQNQVSKSLGPATGV